MPETLTIPPTPPPDIDLEAWHRSIDLVRDWRPKQLAFTHFGSALEVDSQLQELGERLDTWAEWARDQSREEFIAAVRREVGAGAEPDAGPCYEQAAPPDQLYAGLTRYWSKRAEREPASRD